MKTSQEKFREAGRKRKRKPGAGIRRRQQRAAWLFLAPSLTGVAVFNGIPFFDVIRRSFLDAMGKVSVGFANYASVCSNTAFRLAAANTARFLLVCLPLLMLVSFALALLVFRRDGKGGFYKTSLVLPMVIPVAAMLLVWKIILCQDGVLNQLLNSAGEFIGGPKTELAADGQMAVNLTVDGQMAADLTGGGRMATDLMTGGQAAAELGAGDQAVAGLAAGSQTAGDAAQAVKVWNIDWVNGDTAFPVLVITYIWKNAGYDLMLWLAGLASISESLYDAARVDGAGVVSRLRYITIPGLSGTFGLVLILSVVNSFRVYREAYLLAGSYPDMSIYMIPHLFSHWFLTLDVQNMCTASMLLILTALGIAGLVLAGGFARKRFVRT